MKEIYFIIPYPLKESPSQRFRFEQYFIILQNAGYQIKTRSFFSSNEWRLFYSNGNSLQKSLVLFIAYLKRVGVLLSTPSFNYIFIHREATPLGPPIFEWILAKVFRKKIIYDFDDAIWLTDRNEESFLFRTLKWRSKVSSICRWSYKVSCGNEYLAAYALQFNDNVVVNPTTIDTKAYHNPELFQYPSKKDNSIIIGWTGSHSTLKYLSLLERVLQQIEQKYLQVSFLIIADKPTDLKLQHLKFLPWNAETEIQDLLAIDIGIMPLPHDEWAKGKCGFKALQYMALGIPAVISPVGVNKEIISNGVEGFLCASAEEWLSSLEKLIQDESLRKTMGALGRKKVIEHYSVSSNSSNFVSLFT